MRGRAVQGRCPWLLQRTLSGRAALAPPIFGDFSPLDALSAPMVDGGDSCRIAAADRRRGGVAFLSTEGAAL